MIIKNFIKPLIKMTMYFLRIFPVKENKVVFSAFSSRSYSDNPKYIAEEIIRQNLPLDCVFVLNKPKTANLPDGIRAVKYNTVSYLYELATAKIWIDNTRKQPTVVKRKSQYYIQTWHGNIVLKKVEKDAEELLDPQYIKTAKHDSTMIDLTISSSSQSDRIYSEAFWYSGSILKCGSPRNDILVNGSAENCIKVKNLYQIKSDMKIVLYAPTFRESKDLSIYSLDCFKIQESLKKRFGGEWTVMVRLHPNISELKFENEESIDATKYPDMQELLSVVDVLITDYSSSAFDFMLTKRPVFLFAPDINSYIEERGLYMDPFDLPFSCSTTNDEIIENILAFNEQQYNKGVNCFLERYAVTECGTASKSVVDIIKRICI